MADVQGCSVCGIAETYMRAGLDLGEAMFNFTVGSFQNLLGLMLALFILLEVYKLFNPFGTDKQPTEIFNTMAGRIGLVMIVALVALSPTFYMNYIFKPILTVSANFSNILMGASGAFGSDGSKAAIADAQKCLANAVDGDEKIIKTVSCQMGMIQKTIQNGIDLVNEILLKKQGNYSNDIPNMFTKLGDYVAIALVTIIYGFAMMRFPIQSLDLVFRFVIVTVLSPMIIAAYAFPKVRYVTIAGIKGLGHSALTLSFMSGIAGMLSFVMLETMADALEDMGVQNVERTMEGLKAAVAGGTMNVEKFTLLTPAYWQILFLAVVANYLFKQAPNFAKVFIDSNIDDISGGAWDKVFGLTTTLINTTLNIVTLGKAAVVTKTVSAVANALKKL